MSIGIILSEWIFWHGYYYGNCIDNSTQEFNLRSGFVSQGLKFFVIVSSPYDIFAMVT